MLSKIFVLGLLLPWISAAMAQSPNDSQSPVKAQPTSSTQPVEPAISQIRKAVVFIKLVCTDGNQMIEAKGTGFFVAFPDPRMGQDQSFGYLVTNRHVALCWNGSGQPLTVKSISLLFNFNAEDSGTFVKEVALNPNGNVGWILPQDGSVDLAVLPMFPNLQIVDVKLIPISNFATKDILKANRIHEGDSLFFTGFFYQFPGTKRMTPIVRQGIIAMMPDEKIPFVGTPEQLYLADVHAFGGNSGSPAFINLGGFHEGNLSVGQDYRLLGVVNGEISEDENFNLELAATIRGKAVANSGVSTIVPADDLKALLEGPVLQQIRDHEVLVHQLGQVKK